MTEPELRETQLSSREIFDGRILHVFEDTVRLPNGAAASREYLRHIGAVCVIPVLEDGSVLVERQYRYPVAQVLTEIPAGKLDAKDEDHLLAAQRELREMDALAAGDSPIHRLNPLCKLLVTVFYIITVVSFPKYDFSGLVVMVER